MSSTVAIPAVVLLGFVALGVAVAGGIRFHGTRRVRPDHYMGGLMVLAGILLGAITVAAAGGGL